MPLYVDSRTEWRHQAGWFGRCIFVTVPAVLTEVCLSFPQSTPNPELVYDDRLFPNPKPTLPYSCLSSHILRRYMVCVFETSFLILLSNLKLISHWRHWSSSHTQFFWLRYQDLGHCVCTLLAAKCDVMYGYIFILLRNSVVHELLICLPIYSVYFVKLKCKFDTFSEHRVKVRPSWMSYCMSLVHFWYFNKQRVP
jgi:hypothetical protein